MTTTTTTAATSFNLPAADSDQKYVTISPLSGGSITLPDHCFVHPADPGAKRTVPSLAFLITHPGTSAHGGSASKPFHIMFDLGLRRSKDRYPASLQKHLDERAPFALAPGVAAQLASGGVHPAHIDLVILSHVHYDHHGDPEDFPNARFLVGYGALAVLQRGLGAGASHQVFVPDTLPAGRSAELPASTESNHWRPLGPFPAVLDLLGDGSMFVIDTPGHLPGHINLLCRTKDRWFCLCGDAFHDRRLLTGEKEIGIWSHAGSESLCIHVDKDAAKESIRRLRAFQAVAADQVELIAAHDEIWWEQNKHHAYPGVL